MNKEKIKHTKYGELLQSYERLINVDYHACVGAKEKQLWKGRAVRHYNNLEQFTCCKKELLDRYECTVDKAVDILTQDFFL